MTSQNVETAALKALAREKAELREKLETATGEQYLNLRGLVEYEEKYDFTYVFVGAEFRLNMLVAIFVEHWPEHESGFKFVQVTPSDF